MMFTRGNTIGLIGDTFGSMSRREAEVLLKSRGVSTIGGPLDELSLAMLDGLVAPETEVRGRGLAASAGLQVLSPNDLRAELGAPLAGYRGRMERLLAQEDYVCTHAELGPPVDSATFAQIEQRIGFPLPQTARTLFQEVDGVSVLWSLGAGPIALGHDMDWATCRSIDSRLWNDIHQTHERANGRGEMFAVGMACIPRAAEMFSTDWNEEIFNKSAFSQDDVVRVGNRRVRADDFFDQLFLWDSFHYSAQAGVWADPETEELYVVYGFDHGADWTTYAPLRLETYMEQLVAGECRVRLGQTAETAGLTESEHLCQDGWVTLDLHPTNL